VGPWTTGHSSSRARERRTKSRWLAAAIAAAVVFGLSSPLIGGIPASAFGSQSSNHGKPNLFDQKVLKQGTTKRKTNLASPLIQSTLSANDLTRNTSFPMAAARIALSPTASSDFVGSDGVLAIHVPAGAISASNLATDGGSASLLVRQVSPASGSVAGGSGEVSFGGYLIQVVTSTGQLAAHGLDLPITLTLHYGQQTAVDVGHAYIVLNAPLSPWVNIDPTSVSVQGPTAGLGAGRTSARPPSHVSAGINTGGIAAAGSALGPASSEPATLDPAAGTLSGPATMSGASMSVSWGTNSSIATFGKPDRFTVGLSGGGLDAVYPIDVPAGPGGLTPVVQLVYSSASVAEQHSPQGGASWVGEGFNLSLGQISWSEHNTPGASGSQWVDSWQLSDAYGTSAELIPPHVTTSTYYDDTAFTQTVSPIAWHTAPESFIRVYSYNSPVRLSGMTLIPPCFRVYLKNGIMEEFGCTSDSLQWYTNPCAGAPSNTCDYLANWFVDLITDRKGNQIHISYQTDTITGMNGITYPRDTVLQEIQWDSPNCHNGDTACTGTNWAPLMDVFFAPTHYVYHAMGANCGAANGTLRCDDPVTISGGDGSPLVQSDFVLNDLSARVRSSSTAPWQNLNTYRFYYQQSAQSTIQDPLNGQNESVAGELILVELQKFGDDGTTSLPPTQFSYVRQTEYYEDSLRFPSPPTTNCGPTWNTGKNSGGGTNGCLLWSESYPGNSFYLGTVSNGIGQFQQFGWLNARDNMHGVPTGSDVTDTGLCTNASSSTQSSYPCDMTDDETWSRVVLTQELDSVQTLCQPVVAGTGCAASPTTVTGSTTYSYHMNSHALAAQECSSCIEGFSWGNQNDNDYLDFYNGRFMSFAQVTVTHPDNGTELHKFFSTEGWGLYDTTQVTCLENPPNPCHKDSWWDMTQVGIGQNNAAHGLEFEVDYNDTNGTKLKEATTNYSVLCPNSWTGSGSGSATGFGNWNGNLVSELDLGNPVGSCSIDTAQTDSYVLDGVSLSDAVHGTQVFTYGTYDHLATETDTTNDYGIGSPSTIVHKPVFVWSDDLTVSSGAVTGPYLIDREAYTDNEDGSGNTKQCSYSSYDGNAFVTGQQPHASTWGRGGQVTMVDTYQTCNSNSGTTDSGTGQIRTTHAYDLSGNLLSTDTPDANAGIIPSHKGCTVASVQHSDCYAYDGTFGTLQLSQTNALSQVASTGYQAPASGTQAGGFGLWPMSTTDVNSQQTSYTYDPLGRETSITLPAESGSDIQGSCPASAVQCTQAMTYTVTCSGTSAQSPCVEIDTIQRLDTSHFVTTRNFYDGQGHLVETRTPAPGGNDVVVFSVYDKSQRLVFRSIPYFVTSGTGYSTPNYNQPGTTYTYDGLGRQLTATDALSDQTTTAYNVVIRAGSPDGQPYEETDTYDPLNHFSASLVDAWGRTQYVRRYTGGNPYALYATVDYKYDVNGNLIQIVHPDGVTTSNFSYDMAGRQIGLTDPDRGSETYTYDPDGNLTESVDARGASGTVWSGFDGLDRISWRNTTNTQTGAFNVFCYDNNTAYNSGTLACTTPQLVNGMGRLTFETFAGGGGMTGSEAAVYDARGQTTSSTLTVGTTSYPLSAMTYNDIGARLTETYPDGEVVTNSYDSTAGWLQSVSSSAQQFPILANAQYGGIGGAFGEITGAGLDTTQAGGASPVYNFSSAFDSLGRATDIKIKNASNVVLFDEARTFDAASNVTTANTTLSAGTDNQAFCYDEQNRLTSAASSGTVPCQTFSAGTLTVANYNQTFAYDTLGRLTTGPLGGYTYGDSAHVHAATSIGSGYTAAYDASGDMTCRAPTSSTTCNGTQTGAQLAFDNLGMLSTWKNQPSNPTTTATFLYDGSG